MLDLAFESTRRILSDIFGAQVVDLTSQEGSNQDQLAQKDPQGMKLLLDQQQMMVQVKKERDEAEEERHEEGTYAAVFMDVQNEKISGLHRNTALTHLVVITSLINPV